MKIKLLQWNILCDEDPAKIAAFIKEINPDIACLQELTNGYQPVGDVGKYIAAQTGLYSSYHYGPMAMPDDSSSQMGNGIFSKFPIISERWAELQLGVVVEGTVKQDQRSYVETVLKVDGQELTVGTAHLAFRPTMRTSKAKRFSVNRLIKEVTEVSGRYVLAGDFNATPNSWTVNTVKSKLKHAGPALAQKTWTQVPLSFGGRLFDTINWRLDYVFYKGAIKPLQSEILRPKASDHLPILTEFEI